MCFLSHRPSLLSHWGSAAAPWAVVIQLVMNKALWGHKEQAELRGFIDHWGLRAKPPGASCAAGLLLGLLHPSPWEEVWASGHFITKNTTEYTAAELGKTTQHLSFVSFTYSAIFAPADLIAGCCSEPLAATADQAAVIIRWLKANSIQQRRVFQWAVCFTFIQLFSSPLTRKLFSFNCFCTFAFPLKRQRLAARSLQETGHSYSVYCKQRSKGHQ